MRYVITKGGRYFSALTLSWVPDIDLGWWFWSPEAADRIRRRYCGFIGVKIVPVEGNGD